MKNGKSGTVLLYNCSGPEFSKLRQIFAMLRLRMRAVNPDQYHLTLTELADGKGETGEAQEPIQESMLVFCGLGDAFLNQVLQVIRVAKLPPIPLKAVLTASNQEWTTRQLREELLKEREAIAAKLQEQKQAQQEEAADKAEAAEADGEKSR